MKVKPGDRVAVLSPSAAAPQIFPAVHDLGVRRIRELLELEPVEYPTTREQGSAEERAADLMAAYADPGIRAVFATIGGDDQLTVLPHLDPAPFVADPKPYFGYSDNTNVLNWLSCTAYPPTTSARRWCTSRGAAASTPSTSRRCGRRSSRPSTCRSHRSTSSATRS